MKRSTKLLRAIQTMNETKNVCFDFGYDREHKQLLKIRDSLSIKLDKLRKLKQ